MRLCYFFFQAEDGIRDYKVTGVQTCALPILGGGSALGIASTMNIAGHLVDVSPLSTIGALCIASVPSGEMGRKLFNQIGRASCRERVWISVGAGAGK